MRHHVETPLRLAAVAAVAAVLAVPAHAGAPSPTDVEAAAAGHALATILPTGLFALGEVDLALLGVSDAELADVGPTASPDPETDGDNLLIVDDGADCPNAEYPTIQSAVNAAPPATGSRSVAARTRSRRRSRRRRMI